MDFLRNSDEEDGAEKALQSHETYLCQGLKQLYESQQLCDVTLGVEGRSFPCHRMLLASVSPYFREIFIHSTGAQKEIQLEDISASTLHILLDYLYTEELPLTAETAQDLFTAASKLQILPLKETVGRYLEMNISMSNCLRLYSLAHQHNHHPLLQAASHYIRQHFGPLSKKESFLSLEHDALVNLISSDSLDVPSELTVYQAVRNWVESATAARLPLFKQLLGHIRFPLLTHEELVDVQADIAEYYRHMRLKWKDLDGAGRLLESRGLRKGMYDECLVCVEVSEIRLQEGEDPESYLRCFDPHADRWEKLPPLRYVSYSGCTSMDCKLYLSGGQKDNCTFVDTLHEYSALTSRWSQLPSMSAGRAIHPFLACNKKLYALGGCNDAGPLTSAEAFNVAQNVWVPIASLPLALMYPASAVLKHKIYLIGGKASRSYKGLLIYDTVSNWWTEMPMDFSCYGGAAVSVGGGIYVFGGYMEERGNFLANSAMAAEEVPCCSKGSFYLCESGRVNWEIHIPELPVALAFACALEWQGKIYLLAGKDENRSYNASYIWVPDDTSWMRCPDEIPVTNEAKIFCSTTLKIPKKPIRFLLLETSPTSAVVGVDNVKKSHPSSFTRDGCSLNCCWGGS
ncbi:hypothetical protein lerEdw1_010726 [Lerista edwardsae]|nr:hypothetical protein lerEdw1_010726 [Lerista edwardsae]